MDISVNPKDSDFSIVLLDEEIYGTTAFSVLPLETRKLTEEEMRQLIYAYQGAEPETVLQDYCSYRPTAANEQTIAENRPLSSAEAFQLRIALLSGYLMEGKRPKAQEKEAALFFTMQNQSELWIYPKDSMTEEQLLQIIDKKYGSLPKELYTPKEGQISYKDARNTASGLVKKYIADIKASGIYTIYGVGSIGMRESPDFWTAYVHTDGKTNDFYLRFRADNGELLEWRRYPENLFTERGFSGEAFNGYFTEGESADIAVTDEQLIQAAQNYMNPILEKDNVSSESGFSAEYSVADSEPSSPEGVVMVRFGDKKFQIYIHKADLTVYAVRAVL